MGTDIHSVAQVRNDGKWTTVLQCVGGDRRNYDTFAQLANVRNGIGFAGITTGSGFDPLDMPRGFPEDFEIGCMVKDEDTNELVFADDHHPIKLKTPVSDQYCAWGTSEQREYFISDRLYSNSIWMGSHSESHVYLPELKAYYERLQKQTVAKTGLFHLEDYKQLTVGQPPPENMGWCGDSWGKDVVKYTAQEYETMILAGMEISVDKRVYIRYTWEESAASTTNLPKIIAELEVIANQNDVTEENVRYVFGFDS